MMRDTGPRVYTLAVRLAGNVSDGQDLAQETYLKAYKSWASFRGESQAETWLYRICVNCWKNRVRYEKRRSFWKHFSLSASSSEDETPARELAATEPPLDHALESGDERGLLHRALGKLDKEERAILVFRDMEDRSYEEISAILELPLGTVKSRLARSREKLRIQIETLRKEGAHGR
jgi:RNA polymerase sigma-70 factor, ECF subfamily